MKRLMIGWALVVASSAAWGGEASDGGIPLLGGHLEVGTRITHYNMVDGFEKEDFLGTINTLDAKQDDEPSKAFVDILFTPSWGVEVTWDRVRAITRTDTQNRHSDGIFELDGPIVTAFWRSPGPGPVRPYVGVGATWYSCDFEPEPWWALGYHRKSDWVELGSTDRVRNGLTRDMTLEDTVGVVVDAGLDVRVARHWSLDFYARSIDASARATFVETRKGKTLVHAERTIPFDTLTLGLGAKFVF